MKKIFSVFLIVLFALIFQSCSNNSKQDSTDVADSANESKMDSTKQITQTAPITVGDDDAELVVEIANGGLAEVELGMIAQQKATAASTKEFAAMMIADHTLANEELKALAVKKNITLPSTVGKDQQKIKDELTRKAAKDFDKAYIDNMVDDHKKDIKLFEKASKSFKDVDLKAFADKTLPTLKAHLQHCENIQNTLK